MQDIPVSYLTPEECSAAVSSSLPLVENKFPHDPFLNALIAQLKSNQHRLEQSIILAKRCEYTEKINHADSEFDSSFIAFRDYVEASANLTVMPEKASAAQKIVVLISKHGRNLHLLGCQEQIRQMDSFVSELNSPEMLKIMEIAGVRQLYEAVVNRHSALVELFQLQPNTESDRNIPLPYEAKRAVAADLSDLYTYLVRFSRFGTSSYKEAAVNIQGIFGKIIPVARNRHDRNQSSQEQQNIAS